MLWKATIFEWLCGVVSAHLFFFFFLTNAQNERVVKALFSFLSFFYTLIEKGFCKNHN